MTGDLISLIRFWDIPTNYEMSYQNKPLINRITRLLKPTRKRVLTVYSTRGKFHVEKPLTPYKFKRTADIFGNTITGESVNLPITIFRNNSDYKSDMTPSVRAKIDIIDTVNSGFANNIEDFSELFWVVKNASGMDSTRV